MRTTALSAVVLALAISLAGQARAVEGPDSTDVQAETVLKACCERLAGLKSYSFTAEVDRDFAYPTGDTVRMSQTVTVKVRRPDKLRCEVRGDDRDKTYVYDGRNFVAYDGDANAYGLMEGRGSIDETVGYLVEKYGVEAPLVELLYSDPCAKIDRSKIVGRYLGIHYAAGRSCHHLIFFGQDMNWQIWVDEADGLPRKLVITDKSLPGWPQYAAVLTKWDTGVTFPESVFAFKAPKDARQIPVLPLGDQTAGNQ